MDAETGSEDCWLSATASAELRPSLPCDTSVHMRSRLLLAMALLTGCASSVRSGQPSDSIVKSGIFHTGEHAYLETSNGDVFELRVPAARDRQRLYALAPITPETMEPQCLHLRVAGKMDGATELGRPIFVVSKVTEAEAIGCGDNVR